MAWFVLSPGTMELGSDIKLNRRACAILKTASAVFGGVFFSIWAYGTPELVVNLPSGPAVINREYQIGCEISWAGEAGEYIIFPAEIGTLDWGTSAVVKIEAFRRGDEHVVAQTIEIIPKKAGEFDSPEIRVPYLDPEATPPAESSAPQTAPPDSSASPSLRAEPFKIVVRTPRRLVWISGGLGASLLLLTAVGWWSARVLRRPRPTTSGAVPALDFTELQAMLHRIRQYRLDGKFYEFYQGLSRVSDVLGNGPLSSALAGRAQRAGYAGARPSDDELDGDFRDVERALLKRREELTA